MVTNKTHIRELYKLKRQQLPEHTRLALDLQVRDKFFNTFDFKKIKVIHMYLPIAEWIEVDTFPIAYRLQKDFPDVKIVVPYTVSEGSQLEHYYWKPGELLIENKWHIPEPDPESSESANIRDLELIIVPLLAYDLKGHRVGYGAGFYDRFLADCKDKALIVGVSHFSPEDQWIKSEEYDVDMDYCISPEQVYKF